MKKTFLICPVRGVDPSLWQGTVQQLESDGWEVHFPPRDTDQNDDTGLRICSDNFEAIRNADVVHVIWDGNSQGGSFDLGMTFALDQLFGKEIIPVSLPDATPHKSFQNMVTAWANQ